MEIKSLKDFDSLVTLCRKRGIHTMTVGSITFTLLPEAPKSPYKRRKAGSETPTSKDPFELALAEAKSRATRAKEGLTASLTQSIPTQPEAPTGEAPDDLAMLLWSAGGSGDV